MDPSIILQGRSPNVLANYARGRQLGRQTAMEDMLRQNAGGLMQGDPQALNALAAYDPQLAQGMALQRTQEARAVQAHDLATKEANMRMQGLSAEMTRKAQEYAAGLSEAERKAKADKIERALKGGAYFHKNGDKAGYDNFLRQNGIDPAQYPFEQFPAIANTLMPVADILKAPGQEKLSERYKVVGNSLYDLGAEGGPAVVMPKGGYSDIAPPDVKGESELRKEYVGLKPVKAFTEQANAYGRIVASAKDPSPAGDLAMIFNFMKVLDPGSVVRESEFATAESAAQWLQESEEAGMTVPLPVAAAIRRMATGQRLSTEQRNDFLGRAGDIYSQSAQQNEQLAKQYETTAESYGYDAARTVPDFRFKAEGAPPISQRPRVPSWQRRMQSAQPADLPAQRDVVIPPQAPDSFAAIPDVANALKAGDGLTAQDIWDNLTDEAKQAIMKSLSDG